VPNQACKSPVGSVCSHDTLAMADELVMKKVKNERNEKDCSEQSIVGRILMEDKITLQNIAKERVDIISEKMQLLPDESFEELTNDLRALLKATYGLQHMEEFKA